MRPQLSSPLVLVSLLVPVGLAGCSANRVRADASHTNGLGKAAAAALPTMAVIPASVQDRDRVLIVRLGGAFSAAWARETGGSYLPVIPDSGQPFDAVRATSEQVQRTGQWSEATVDRLASASATDYVLLLWVKRYGLGWDQMTQTKEIRLGFLLASGSPGRRCIAGQGETIASGRRESFDSLERKLVASTVQTVIALLSEPDQPS